MFRRIFVILTVANLLLCPLMCMGALTGADRDVASRKPTCNCGMCEHSREVPVDRLPPAEKPCDSCQCLCGGAVSLKDAGPEIAPEFGIWTAIDPGETLLVAQLQMGIAAEFCGIPPDPGSGRLLRLELASLLC